MNQQPQQPVNYAPYKVESEDPERKFKILDNGDVEMTEIAKSVIWFHGREFISFQRQHLQDKEILKNSISKETIEKIKKDIEKNKRAIDILDPLVKEVEEKLKAEYERKLLEGKANGIKAELAKKPKDRKPGFAEAIWSNLSEEDKPKVMGKLNKAEKAEIVNFKVQQKKKQRGNSAKAQ